MIKEYQLRKQQNSYEVTLYYKGVKVRVAFTGGNVYKGVMPKCRTDNAFKMRAIEASELFRNKEVVLARTIGTEEKPKAAVVQRRNTAGMPPRSAEKKPTRELGGEMTGTADESGKEAEAGTKEFDNLGEAIMFIAREWQIGVQTEAEARKVLKEHGVTARIKRG